MRTRKMLDLSTAHLPERARGGIPGMVCYPYEYGVIVHVPDEPALPENDSRHEAEAEGMEDAYDAVHAIRVRARALGCDFIMFDSDGEVEDGEFAVFEGV